MKAYLDLLKYVLENGEKRSDRTGTGTISVFGTQTRYNLADGFPLVTTKKIHVKSIIHELLWFLRGESNIQSLKAVGVSIWDEWGRFVGDYPNKNRIVDLVEAKSVQSDDYNGNFSTKGLNAKKDSIEDKLRSSWVKMMKRCYDKTSHNYDKYGALGVKVRKDWHNVINFVNDVKKLKNWENKLNNWNSYELDKDYYNSNTYSKDSCVWLHTAENNLYTKNFSPFNLKLDEKNFLCMSFSHAEELTGIPKTTLYRWAKNGKSNQCDLKYRNIKFNFNDSKISQKPNHLLRYLFTDGNLGPVYGAQWRSWQTQDGKVVDQIKWVIEEIKKNPNSRRLIVSAWNVSEIEEMALPPCHTMFQFYVSNNKLSCHLYQRSGDLFLGVPFNIASYALLTMMVAQVTNLEVGEFVHTIGDAHIYLDHVDQVKEQLSRETRPLPTMTLNKAVKNIDDFKFEDFTLTNYDPHPAIKGKVSV